MSGAAQAASATSPLRARDLLAALVVVILWGVNFVAMKWGLRSFSPFQLGAARYLAATRQFDGTLNLIFQPAEEGGAGAREMIADGLFSKFPMDAIYGMHNWPGFAAGQFAASAGPTRAVWVN